MCDFVWFLMRVLFGLQIRGSVILYIWLHLFSRCKKCGQAFLTSLVQYRSTLFGFWTCEFHPQPANTITVKIHHNFPNIQKYSYNQQYTHDLRYNTHQIRSRISWVTLDLLCQISWKPRWIHQSFASKFFSDTISSILMSVLQITTISILVQAG